MNTNKPLCIYHGNCMDGFTAAWVVRKYYGEDNVDFHAGVYQTPPPDVTGRDVIIVDFSYKLPIVTEMADIANSILILDHHKSAIEDLRQFTECHPTIETVFDIERSGAMITWDYFFPDEEASMFIRYVEDRDLWRFKLPGTKEFVASVFSYPYDFEIWDKLMETPVGQLIGDGVAIERKHHKDIAELLNVVTLYAIINLPPIGEVVVPCANLPYTFSSDACHSLALTNKYGIGLCYWDTSKGRVFSLRSTEEGYDVSRVAVLYGGGGHKHAAGMMLTWDKVGSITMWSTKEEAEESIIPF